MFDDGLINTSAKVTFFIAAYRQTNMTNQFGPSLAHENLRPSTFDLLTLSLNHPPLRSQSRYVKSGARKLEMLERAMLWRLEFLPQHELKNPCPQGHSLRSQANMDLFALPDTSPPTIELRISRSPTWSKQVSSTMR